MCRLLKNALDKPPYLIFRPQLIQNIASGSSFLPHAGQKTRTSFTGAGSATGAGAASAVGAGAGSATGAGAGSATGAGAGSAVVVGVATTRSFPHFIQNLESSLSGLPQLAQKIFG